MPDIVRVGGIQYSWNSTLTLIDLQPFRGLIEIDWGEKLDVETVYSQTQDGVPIGSTAGQYAVENFTMKFLREYAEALKAYLAGPAPGVPPGNRGLPGSYGQTTFLFQMTATEPLQIGATPVVVNAGPCRIIGQKQTTAKGSNALETEFTLWCQQISVNGITLYSPAVPGL